MKNKDSAIFFDKFAATFDTFYEGKRNIFMQFIDKKFRKDIFLRFTKTFEYIGSLSEKTVIDIGCGSGIYVEECLRQGVKFVTGVDPAPGMLELAAKRLTDEEFKDRFALKDGYFPDCQVDPHDFAIVMGVMDYIEDPSQFLKELQKTVRIAASVSFPSKHWFRTPFRKIRYRLRNCPVYFYDEVTIKRLADNAGFKSIEFHKVPGAGQDYVVLLKN